MKAPEKDRAITALGEGEGNTAKRGERGIGKPEILELN